MSFFKNLGWAVILDWLFGRKNGKSGKTNYHASSRGYDHVRDAEIDQLENKIQTYRRKLDSMEDELYGMTDEYSDEYVDLEDRIDDLQNEIFDMEDELDDLDDF